jgi:flavin-binding protein dodecin
LLATALGAPPSFAADIIVSTQDERAFPSRQGRRRSGRCRGKTLYPRAGRASRARWQSPRVGRLEPVADSKGDSTMAKKSAGDGVYRIIDVIGTSSTSWEDAAKSAVSTASKSLRDLRIAEVSKLDMKVEGGKVVAYRARVQLSFKYEA